jgi:hypothetical protein
VRDDLGVGVAGQFDAAGLQLGAEPGEVLDDAVVDDRDPAVGGGVRVRVAVVGRAVGGPAGVPDAGGGGAEPVGAARPFGERLLQVAELPGALLGQYW